MDNIETVIKRILLGDERAFEQLVTHYQKLVYHLAYRVLKDPCESEEVMQEVFITVYRKLHQFKHQSKFSTWISSITYRLSINHYQKTKRFDFKESAEAFNESDVRYDPEVFKGDLKRALDYFLEQLPVLHRTALTLYHYEEMRYDEISSIMNLPEGTVKTYIFRARKTLKELISKSKQQTLLYG
jgi:RNA polymerase sigma-70 factor (ECF subfamily)